MESGAEAGKIVDVGIVAAEAGAETEVRTTTVGTEVPVVRGGTANTDTKAVRAKSGERDPGGVAAEAVKGAVRVLGREATALRKKMIAMRNKAALKIQVTKGKLEALTM